PRARPFLAMPAGEQRLARGAHRGVHALHADPIATLAEEIAHELIRVARGPRAGVVPAHLRGERLVRLAEQRSPLISRLDTRPLAQHAAEPLLDRRDGGFDVA